MLHPQTLKIFSLQDIVMFLISDDKFFVSGIRELIAKEIFHNSNELMILDASPFLYIIDTSWFFSREFKKDPFTALLYCSDFLYTKKIDVDGFLKALHKDKKNKNGRISKNITTSELKILRSIYNGDEDKVIAKQLNCSKKTISTHKINALHKMKIKNNRAFNILANFWKTSFSRLELSSLAVANRSVAEYAHSQ